jgi:hypothetical protein
LVQQGVPDLKNIKKYSQDSVKGNVQQNYKTRNIPKTRGVPNFIQ